MVLLNIIVCLITITVLEVNKQMVKAPGNITIDGYYHLHIQMKLLQVGKGSQVEIEFSGITDITIQVISIGVSKNNGCRVEDEAGEQIQILMIGREALESNLFNISLCSAGRVTLDSSIIRSITKGDNQISSCIFIQLKKKAIQIGATFQCIFEQLIWSYLGV